MRRTAAALLPLVALAAAFGPRPAAAQDRDPFDAVKAQEDLRARPSVQLHRAEDRVVDPFHPDLLGTGESRQKQPAAPAPPSGGSGGPGHPGIGVWVLGGLVAVAGIAFFAMRRRDPGPRGRRT